jgi:hypothetical protein
MGSSAGLLRELGVVSGDLACASLTADYDQPTVGHLRVQHRAQQLVAAQRTYAREWSAAGVVSRCWS